MESFGMDSALAVSRVLCSVAITVATLELLVGRGMLKDDQILSWPVSRLRSSFLALRLPGRLLDRLLRYRMFVGLLGLRLVLLAAVLWPGLPERWRGVLLALVAATLLLAMLRSPYGQDGSDQMSFLVVTTLALASLAGSDRAKEICLWFLALQLCLSYLTAGSAKLFSAVWRSGAALPMIFRTRIYGHAQVHRWVEAYPRLGRVSCVSVILLEVLFPLVLIVPPPVAGALIVAAASFHLATAVFMGLNTFFLSFVAAYPALWYCVAGG